MGDPMTVNHQKIRIFGYQRIMSAKIMNISRKSVLLWSYIDARCAKSNCCNNIIFGMGNSNGIAVAWPNFQQKPLRIMKITRP